MPTFKESSSLRELCHKEEREKQEKQKQVSAQRAVSLQVSHQLTLAESLRSKNAYNKESDQYRNISRKLAIFLIGSTSLPTSIVENLEFKDLLYTMDSRYIVQGRVAIRKELDKVVIELKAKISSFLLEVNKSRICVDIWSKRGMSSFYLGITAHFYSSKDHRRHSVTLAMRHMPQTHTGNNIHEIVKSVLDEWDIPSSKISATLTDNGSNMIAAFRPQILEAESDDNTEENQDTEESGEDSEQLSREFEEKESEHDIAFTGLNKVSCFTHTLQLVVHKFEELAEFKSILKRAHSLV